VAVSEKRSKHLALRRSNSEKSIVKPPPPVPSPTPMSLGRVPPVIIDEEEELKAAPWYQPGLSREISMEILSPLPVGSFLVRCSESRIDSLALSVKVPNSAIVHYLITSGGHGWKIKGSAKHFTSLLSLIIHHSVMCELLPCCLALTGAYEDSDEASAAENGDFIDLAEALSEDLMFTLRKAFGSSPQLDMSRGELCSESEISSQSSSM